MIKKIKSILFEEGILNYIQRKRNITYLDSKTIFTIKYRKKNTKIVLNRKFGHVDMMIFKNGIYEKEIVDDIYSELDSSKILLDIGSNIGQHSLLLSPYCKEVHSFEPIKSVYDQFNESIRINRFQNIHTYNIAVSDKKESKSFNFVKNHAGTSSFVEREAQNEVEKITVHTDTLANILIDKKIDVIKIDVEGFEAVAIMGNKDFILKNRPVIFLEYNPNWIDREGSYSSTEFFNFFIDNNYQVYSRRFNKNLSKENLNTESQDNWIAKPL